MAQEKLISKPGNTITRKLAAAVASIPTGTYLPVVATANEGEVKVADSQNAVVEGFLGVTGAAGDQVPIVIDGIVPVQVDAATSRMQQLMTSSNGRMFPCAKTSGTTYNLAGFARTKATAAQEFVSVQILPQTLRIKA